MIARVGFAHRWGLIVYCSLCLSLMVVSGCGQPKEDEEKESSLSVEQLAVQGEEKETLISTMVQLERRFQQVTFGQRVQDCKVIVKIVDQLMEMELTPEERARAITSQLDALTKLHSTREVNSSERLKELAKQYNDDSDPEVARAAKIAGTATKLVDFIRTDVGKFEPLKESIRLLLSEYPNDIDIAQNLEQVAVQLFQREKRTEARSIMSQMVLAYSKSPSAEMREYVGILNDRIKLVEMKFSDLVQGVDHGGAKERADFERGLRKLASDHSIGFTVYDEISRASRWLERNGLHSAAGEIYQVMDQQLTKHPDATISERAKEEARLGKKRLLQLGKKVELVGSTVLGDEIDPKDFEGRVVLLYFWSAEKPLSLQGMGELFSLYSSFPRNQFEIIAISTDDDARKPIQVLGTQIPPWTILIPNSDEQTENLIDRCGVHYVPYTVLLDSKGRVDRINLSIGSLDQNIRRLIRRDIDTGQNTSREKSVPELPVREADRRKHRRVFPKIG